ncbi:MAG: complex I NDUFA9 subunit family protein, partial [Paracoccaceae bacterium]
MPQSKLVTIFGGSGFVGRYIARRMAAEGWRVRVACRNPNDAIFVRTYGVVGQVEPVFCNIRDDASVSAVLTGADAVANCIGVLAESGANTFEAVQHQGAERVARLSKEAGAGRMLQISAIGADPDSASAYARTKAAGEAAVLRHRPDATILRPSIIFGPEDEFFNRFATMARLSPVLPVVGGRTRFQPVYVDDVAQAAVAALTGRVAPGIYELGGPEVATFRNLMQRMLRIIRRRALIVDLPFWLARPMARGMELGETLTFGLAKAQLTRDQVANLQYDNVVADGAKGFEAFGITPMTLETILPMGLAAKVFEDEESAAEVSGSEEVVPITNLPNFLTHLARE